MFHGMATSLVSYGWVTALKVAQEPLGVHDLVGMRLTKKVQM